MKGWWSQEMARASFSSWLRATMMVYGCWLPPVGAWQAASRMARSSAALTGSAVNARTDLRTCSCAMTSFMWGSLLVA